MDWKEIQEKYTKAFELMLKYFKFPSYTRDIMRLNERLLYDFFDKNEIYINIDTHMGEFNWSIEYIPNNMAVFIDEYSDSMNFHTRKETEQTAFIKAFEILEDKL